MSDQISKGDPKESLKTTGRQKLTLGLFKKTDYRMTKEEKNRIDELRKVYTQIDDAFLSQFETRYIIFIEDGTDLKNDCRCFPEVKR